MADRSSPDGARRPPRSIVVAVALVVAEAAVLGVLAIVEMFSLDGGRLGLGLTNAAFFVAYAVGLAFCARGLLRLSRWTRSPIVMTQLIQLGVAWSFYGHDTVWLAVVLAVVAVVVLGIMFAPATTTILYGETKWYEEETPER